MLKGMYGTIPYEVDEKSLTLTIKVKGEKYSRKIPAFVLDRPVRVVETYVQGLYAAMYRVHGTRWSA